MIIDWIFGRFSKLLVVQNFSISSKNVPHYFEGAKFLILLCSPVVVLLISVGIKKFRLLTLRQ